jgi:hypothetical protein
MYVRGKMFAAALAVALGCSVVAADGTVIVRDGGGGPVNCTANDCDTRDKPTSIVDSVLIEDCEPDNPTGSHAFGVGECVDNVLDAFGVETLEDGYGNELGVVIVTEDEELPECIGVIDTTPQVGMIELRLTGSGRSARIYKFTGDPLGDAPLPPGFDDNEDHAVHVSLNAITIVIPTTEAMGAAQLNVALDSALRSQFVITTGVDAGGHYWIVHRERLTSAAIHHVSVRADDAGLEDMRVELSNDPTTSCPDSY